MTTDLPAPDAASGSHRPPLNYYGELARRQWEGQAKDHERYTKSHPEDHVRSMAGRMRTPRAKWNGPPNPARLRA